MQETLLILDFGSQYTQLIARRVRELNVYCEIHPFNNPPEFTNNIKGVILSGSPYSTLQEDAPKIDLTGIKGDIPLLGICYGAQYLALTNGGSVAPSEIREYGRANLSSINEDVLFAGVDAGSQVWMSHGDTITTLPSDFKIIASTADVQVAGYKVANEKTYGIQFHPEVYHSSDGKKMLHNFLFDIVGMAGDWTPSHFVEETV